MAKPMKTLELHYPMTQFLIITDIICERRHEGRTRPHEGALTLIFVMASSSVAKVILSFYRDVHGRNIRERNNFPGYSGVQRREIHKGDIKTHYKPTETFQYTNFTSCHPPGVKRGEAIRLLRTNSSKTTFEECLANFSRRL